MVVSAFVFDTMTSGPPKIRPRIASSSSATGTGFANRDRPSSESTPRPDPGTIPAAGRPSTSVTSYSR